MKAITNTWEQNKKYARLAGLYWWLFVIFGIISYLVIEPMFLVEEDAAKTLDNINSNLFVYFLGVLSFVVGYGVFIPLAISLRKLFKPVNHKVTNIMMSLVITGTAIVLAGKALEIFALKAGIEEAVRLFELRAIMEMAAELFWGLWLIPLVILIFKSSIIPTWVGWLLAAAAFTHLCIFTAFFFVRACMPAAEILFNLSAPCELIPAAYLLIKGMKIPRNKLSR